MRTPTRLHTNAHTCMHAGQDVARKYPDGLPRLDPVEDMGIEEPALLEAASKLEGLEAQLASNPGVCVCVCACVCVCVCV